MGLQKPLVSVLVVNYNRADLLQECLESLIKQTFTDLEIIVVDNGSTDSSRTVLDSFPAGRVIPLFLDSNTGFAGGCNAGFRIARGTYVALLNNDATAAPDWISELVRAVHDFPEYGMWASKILFAGTDIIDKTGHLIFWDGQNRGRGTGEKDTGQYDEVGGPLFPDGCAALYRRDLLEEAGGFDEDFFAYADDADLGLRLRWMGCHCGFAPKAVVHHRHSSTLGGFSPEKVYLVERNRFWLVLKNFPWPMVLVSPAFTLVRWAWNLAGLTAGKGPTGNYLKNSSVGSLVKAVLRAYLDAVRGVGPVLSRRREVFKNRRISSLDFFRLIRKYRISARQLALRDRQI